MTNIKFYQQAIGASEVNKPLNYIVTYRNERKLSNGDIEWWTEGFNVIDGHFELKDENFLPSKCIEISKLEYLNATKGFYTPEYLLVEQWEYFGDVNPIEHGGTWVKKFVNESYDFVKITTDFDGTVYIGYGQIDLDVNDNWMDIKAVEVFGDCKISDTLYFIDSALSYYSMHEFGTYETFNLENTEEIFKELKLFGIDTEEIENA